MPSHPLLPEPTFVLGRDRLTPFTNGDIVVHAREDAKQSPPRYDIRQDGSSVVRTYLVNGTDWRAFTRVMLGYPVIKDTTLPIHGTSAKYAYISRRLPHRVLVNYDALRYDQWIPDAYTGWGSSDGTGHTMPYMTVQTSVQHQPVYAYASKCTVALDGPWNIVVDPGSEGGSPPESAPLTYTEVAKIARVEVLYETKPYEIISDARATAIIRNRGWNYNVPHEGFLVRYVTRQKDPVIKYTTLSGSMMFFYDDDDASKERRVAGPMAHIESYYDLTYIWHNVPFVPWHADLLLGCTNYHAFDIYPPFTLQYMSYAARPVPEATFGPLFNIEYKMRYYPRGSCHIIDPQKSIESPGLLARAGLRYTQVTSNGYSNGRRLYPPFFWYPSQDPLAVPPNPADFTLLFAPIRPLHMRVPYGPLN